MPIGLVLDREAGVGDPCADLLHGGVVIGCDLPTEVSGDEHDPHFAGDGRLSAIAGRVEEGLERFARSEIEATPMLRSVTLKRCQHLGEIHGGHHRGVAQCLEFHVAAVFRPLQLDDHQASLAIDREEIDTPVGIGPLTELFRDHEDVVAKRRHVVQEETLDVASLVDPEFAEGLRILPRETAAGDSIDRHLLLPSPPSGHFATSGGDALDDARGDDSLRFASGSATRTGVSGRTGVLQIKRALSLERRRS